MSHRKQLLFVLEFVAWLVGGCGLLLAVSSSLAKLPAVPTDAAFVVAFLFVMVPFATGTYLISEYRQATSHPALPVSSAEEVSPSEIAALLMWANRPHIVAAGLGLLIGLACMFNTSNVSLHAPDDLAPSQAYGIAALLLIFAWLPLPILASAARMPGAYSKHFSWKPANGA